MSKADFQQIVSDQTPAIQELAYATRDFVLSIRPDANLEVESSWGGYLLFKQAVEAANTVCFISAYKKHVSLGFSQGVNLDDPNGLLKGTGKLQRHVKLKKPADLQNPALKEILIQAWSLQPADEVMQQTVGKLREVCLSLPRASETLSHGHPTFKVGKKSFAIYGIYSPSVAFKADIELHSELEGDERVFPTPYMANKGWLSISLDENTDWDVIGRFVRHSYDLALG